MTVRVGSSLLNVPSHRRTVSLSFHRRTCGVRRWTGLVGRLGGESRKGKLRGHTRMLSGQAKSPQEELPCTGMKEWEGNQGYPEWDKGKKVKVYKATSYPDTLGRSLSQRQTGPISVHLVFLAHVFRLLNGLRGAHRPPRLAHVAPSPTTPVGCCSRPPPSSSPSCSPHFSV